jgi:peptidoglycan/xylan/chitin deacetylase (PgdA/CDA1 family)
LAEKEVLVLCYHSVADLSGDPVLAQYGMPVRDFADQMDSLLGRGFTFISPDDFAAMLDGSGDVPRGGVLLTFDDCYRELAGIARDVLEPRGIRGIAFAVSGMPSGTNEWDQKIGARRLQLLDADGLKELAAHGVEVGCHSRSHRPMASLSDSELAAETKGAADSIAALGLPRPRFFAYPHGQHDQRVRSAVRDAGFTAAFGLLSRRAGLESDHFAVPRVEILARDVGWRFRFKTNWPRLERLLRIRSIAVRGALRAARAVRKLAPWRSRHSPEATASVSPAGRSRQRTDGRVPSERV